MWVFMCKKVLELPSVKRVHAHYYSIYSNGNSEVGNVHRFSQSDSGICEFFNVVGNISEINVNLTGAHIDGSSYTPFEVNLKATTNNPTVTYSKSNGSAIMPVRTYYLSI